jgi:F-type H+-transporting ATPase subunit delta
LETVFEELTAVKDLISLEENAPYMRFLSAVQISGEEKCKSLESVFGGKISQLTLDFLCLISQKGRFSHLFEIYGDFRARYNEKMNILEVTAVTAEPLSARLREKLVDKLGKVTGKKIVLSEKTDKSIIGGIVLRYANTEIDSSVKTRLDKLKAQIDGVIA